MYVLARAVRGDVVSFCRAHEGRAVPLSAPHTARGARGLWQITSYECNAAPQPLPTAPRCRRASAPVTRYRLWLWGSPRRPPCFPAVAVSVRGLSLEGAPGRPRGGGLFLAAHLRFPRTAAEEAGAGRSFSSRGLRRVSRAGRRRESTCGAA